MRHVIRGVAFDLEGTIIDVEAFHFDSFVLAAEKGGLKLTKEDIIQKIPHAIGGGDAVNARGIKQLSGDRLSEEWILAKKREYYNEMLSSCGVVNTRPGFLSVFAQIQELGFPVAIGSLTPEHQAKVLFARTGLDQLFLWKNVVILEHVKNKKSAPDVYLETARRMEIKPQEQLIFEDSAVGIISARQAGSFAIGMPTGFILKNLIEMLSAGANRIFMDWRELNIKALIANLNGEQT